MRYTSRVSSWIVAAAFLGTWAARAEDKKADDSKKDPNQAGELLEVEKVKEKYWAQGKDAKLGVVQNRLYSKEGKFTLGVLGGTTIADPFLSIQNIGGEAAYHFSEFLGAEIVGWANHVGPSSALQTAQSQGYNFNTVEPRYFIAAEALGSIMYGKLSLLGKKILYYDMHLSAGLGTVRVEHDGQTIINATPTLVPGNANVIAFTWGLGQRFYISQNWSLRLDYRNVIYQETIVEKVKITSLGQLVGNREEFAHTINLGFDYMFDFRKKADIQ